MKQIVLASLLSFSLFADYTWVQATDSGFARRTITTLSACPEGMSVRATSTKEFPVTVCEMPVLSPVEAPGPVAVLGDTGCRILVTEKREEIQNCNDPVAWPFETVIQNIASSNPSLTIHVGDYVYMESPCPTNDLRCTKRPHGDNWETWEANFFAPAKQLLVQAPWVFLRGNHEDCDRNGLGWFRFLDPRPNTDTCQDFTEPYALSYAGLNLIIMDNSNATDSSKDLDVNNAEIFIHQFKLIQTLIKNHNWKSTWLLAHKPFWSLTPHKGKILYLNPTLQTAYETAPPEIQLILSGHIHFLQTLSFKDTLPTQIIAGMSGTLLDPAMEKPSQSLFKTRELKNSETISEFGHLLIYTLPTKARLDFIALDNKAHKTFNLEFTKPKDEL